MHTHGVSPSSAGAKCIYAVRTSLFHVISKLEFLIRRASDDSSRNIALDCIHHVSMCVGDGMQLTNCCYNAQSTCAQVLLQCPGLRSTLDEWKVGEFGPIFEAIPLMPLLHMQVSIATTATMLQTDGSMLPPT